MRLLNISYNMQYKIYVNVKYPRNYLDISMFPKFLFFLISPGHNVKNLFSFMKIQ